MSSDGRAPALHHALVLGLLQGPCELLPVSSSAHVELVPWLARWPYASLAGSERKSFAAALHAGTGLALAIHMRDELAHELTHLDRRRAIVVALSVGPAALAGYALEEPIEHRLGGPRSIAGGLLTGALALALGELRARRRPGAARAFEDAGGRDGLALGLAQAVALIPGISRSGACLTAARARGFSRPASQALCWHAGLPVLLGAGALKIAPGRGRERTSAQRATLALGAVSAFLSTRASARLLDRRLRDGRTLLACSLYRCLLAAYVLRRSRSARVDR